MDSTLQYTLSTPEAVISKSVYHQYTSVYISTHWYNRQYTINSTAQYTLSTPEAVSIRQFTISILAVSTHLYTVITQAHRISQYTISTL